MDNHVEKCIHFFELMAESHEKSAEEYGRKHNEAGPGSYWFDLQMKEKAQADAYRTCVNTLRDPNF